MQVIRELEELCLKVEMATGTPYFVHAIGNYHCNIKLGRWNDEFIFEEHLTHEEMKLFLLKALIGF